MLDIGCHIFLHAPINIRLRLVLDANKLSGGEMGKGRRCERCYSLRDEL